MKARLIMTAMLVGALAGCGTTASQPPPSRTPAASTPSIDLPTPNGGVFDLPQAKTPKSAVSEYLHYVQHNNCVGARVYTEYAFYKSGDICIGPYESSEGVAEGYRNQIALDGWRFNTTLPAKHPGANTYVYAVDLHITKHACSGSICSNGWHTVLIDVRTGQASDYNSGPGVWLLHQLGTGP